jgi:iron complex outermembrane receptor protein
MSKSSILILILILFNGVLAAQTILIQGTVRDADTERELPGSNMMVMGTGKGTVTDAHGNFQIEIQKGDQIIISFLGFKSDTLTIQIPNDNLEIFLKPSEQLLEEVAVTAISRASLIKENPISVSTVSAKMIERSNESNLMDALSKSTPGLSTLKTGPNISKPFIRGMGFNRVLTVYDGVRQEGQQWGGEHGLEIDNYNIERAEVIKGPASLVYGSDALAGVVSFLPFIPKEDDGKIRGRLISEYQSNNGLIGNGFRISQGGKHWVWMLRGSYRLAKNYSNAVDGKVYNTGFDERNLSALLGFTGEHGHTYLNFTLYDNLQGIPDGSRDSLTRKFTKQVNEGDLDDIKGRPIVSDADLNSYALSPLHQRIQHYRAYANSHYHAGKGDINAMLAFSQNIRREFNHPDFPDQAGTYLQLNTINYNVRCNAPEFSGVEASAGVNGMFQNNKLKDATNFPVPTYDLTDFGIFAVAKWKKEKWTVVGGARLDMRSIKTYDFYSRQDANGFDREATSPDTVGATKQFSAAKQSFTGVSLSAGFTYQFDPAWSLKFNFSRGYRAPSISEIGANGLDAGAHIIYIGNKNFESEFSWQEDLGIFVNKDVYSASVSLFNKHIQNYIYLNQVTDASGQPIADAQGNRTFQYQQSSAQLYGLEATLDLHPSSWKGFSWSNQLALCYGFNRKKEFENTGVMGEYLPFIPPPHVASSLNYEWSLKLPVFSSLHTSLEWDFTTTQNQYLALFDTETRTPGFALTNFSLGLDSPSDKRTRWQWQFQVNNLFDIAYQSNLSRLKYFEYYTASTSGRYGIYSMGRNLCVKMIFTF